MSRNIEEIKKVLSEKANDFASTCAANHVPAAVIFAIEKDGHTETNSTILTPTRLGVELSEDRITPLVAVAGTGKYRIVPIREVEVFDESTYYPDEV